MIRTFFIFLFLFSGIVLYTQGTKTIDTTRVITKLKAGDHINLETGSLKFIRVIEDSRCPSDTECVWAGQATVLIGIYRDTILIEEKKYIFGADGITPDTTKELLISDQKTIWGYHLNPYPTSETPIEASEYYLEVLVK